MDDEEFRRGDDCNPLAWIHWARTGFLQFPSAQVRSFSYLGAIYQNSHRRNCMKAIQYPFCSVSVRPTAAPVRGLVNTLPSVSINAKRTRQLFKGTSPAC